MRILARCLIIAVTIASWIAISNHCAIGALTTKPAKAQSGCPFHSKPAKPKTNPTQCCKILRATPNAPAKTLAPSIVDLPDVDFALAELFVFAPPKFFFSPATLDTGPPGTTSFVELIGSVQSHAPPIV